MMAAKLAQFEIKFISHSLISVLQSTNIFYGSFALPIWRVCE